MSEKTAIGHASSKRPTNSSDPVDKPPHASFVEQSSWEYLMPKRRERMAGYIRESDPSLADSTTIESQAKAVRAYAEKEGYTYDVEVHEYREAISAYTVPYMERLKLIALLAAAKRHEFDVLAVTEVRAISRRQVEVFIVYDMLQKYGVRLETVKEKFEDDAMGRLILGLRAAYAEIEREQSYIRMQRGKKDRIEIGHAPNGHPKPAYGYVFVDTQYETRAAYAFNNVVIYVDADGVEWTEVKIVLYIFDLIKQGESIKGVAAILNEKGIPPPKKPRKGVAHWQAPTVHRILTNKMYIGEVWANKYKRVYDKDKKKSRVYKRPAKEQYLLPDGTAPALIDCETFEKIQRQLAYNKEDSVRNSKHPNVGILRAGYCKCGICGRTMHVLHHPTPAYNRRKPEYYCRQKSGKEALRCNHATTISVHILDIQAREKIVEVLHNPALVRAKVAQLREENKPVVNTEDVETTIESIRRQMKNLYTLAQNATDDETISNLTVMLHDLERQKQKAEALIYDIEEDDEERAEVEEEIVKFEKWVADVQPFLTDPTYTPTYDELRLAVHILGIKAIVFPASGDYPFRARIDVTIPEIMKKLHCVTNDPW